MEKRANIPEPSLIRLCQVKNILDKAAGNGEQQISSNQLGNRIGTGAHTIRKDLTYLGETIEGSKAGYDITLLRSTITKVLKLDSDTNACIVGLGRLGSALLHYNRFSEYGISVVAAFDSNINKVETMRTNISLYPDYELDNIVKSKDIDLAILAVPEKSVEICINQLHECGIKGILNYTNVILPATLPNGIHVRNVDAVSELQILSTQIKIEQQ